MTADNSLFHKCLDFTLNCILHFFFSYQDRSIAVWDMVSPAEINLRRVLVGHRAAVNVVDFDEKYIVSASGDRTIKVSLILVYLSSKQYDPSSSVSQCSVIMI